MDLYDGHGNITELSQDVKQMKNDLDAKQPLITQENKLPHNLLSGVPSGVFETIFDVTTTEQCTSFTHSFDMSLYTGVLILNIFSPNKLTNTSTWVGFGFLTKSGGRVQLTNCDHGGTLINTSYLIIVSPGTDVVTYIPSDWGNVYLSKIHAVQRLEDLSDPYEKISGIRIAANGMGDLQGDARFNARMRVQLLGVLK